MTASRRLALLLAGLAAFGAGCGKKGPPLPPLRLVPGGVTETAARRAGPRVELRFVLPTANQNGPGPVDLEQVEVYAMTIGAGDINPANRDLLDKSRIVGTIPVKPPPVDGASDETPPAQADAADKRPAPGEAVTFVEELTAEALTPVPVPPSQPGDRPRETGADDRAAAPPAGPPPAVGIPVVPPAGSTGTSTMALPGAPSALPGVPVAAPSDPDKPPPPAVAPPPAPVTFPYPVRVYAIRGLAKGGRPGPPANRIVVPLVEPPAAPGGVAARATETALVLGWTGPAEAGAPGVGFNVYRAGGGTPINAAPIAAVEFQQPGVELGKEQCFVVRTVRTIETVTMESADSAPACITPRDTFAPAAPQGLRAVAEPGAINLIWDPNAEPDIAGYLVLRAEAPGDTLQPLTPAPVADASFRDTTAKPGVQYVYAIVAVDTAAPANRSAESAREVATAR